MNAPHTDAALEAEQALLGGLLLDGSALARVNGLRPEHFALDEHRHIFIAIKDQAEDGEVDLVTVGDRLRRNGAADEHIFSYLGGLAQNTHSVAAVGRYAEIVQRHARRRELQSLGAEIAARAERGDPDEIRRDVAARLAAIDARGADAWPQPLDLAQLAAHEPERPRHLVDPWLPAGEVTLLAGHGGAFKSSTALHLAACIALGVPWHGIACERRRVLYVSAEDPAAVVHWRLARICAHLGVALGELAGRLEVIDASHMNAELMVETRDGPIITALYDELRARVEPASVLVLDGASDLYGASEITRVHVRRYIRALRRLIDAEGAVLLLAHVDKAVARGRDSGDGYSGSTAWHNSVRARWALRADGDDLVLALEKTNHAKAGAEIRLRWNADAHLYLPIADGGIVASIRERTEREGILAAMRACNEPVPAAMTGPRTGHHVLAARPELPESLRDSVTGKRTFWRRIEELRAMGAVIERSIARKDRHYVRVLVAVSEERGPCGQ